jgi:hypothetical protein
MYTSYNLAARNAILYFMSAYFPDKDKLVTPIYPIHMDADLSVIKNLLQHKSFDEGLKVLNEYLKTYIE